ncbi:hypothetical protein L6452_08951 [Arctium lappa]|uniref:Uncharacterized protein n=1 Tax=Arctium lappa TaxID=4217 RepID=A0ACB9DJP8_ARCLA|nr:hypothetical protein L6452_08951 [Arctium lappa]
MLDQVGDVIVLGNIVFPRPDQLAKSMEKLVLQSMAILNDPRKQQLEELERQKAFIDKSRYPKFVVSSIVVSEF